MTAKEAVVTNGTEGIIYYTNPYLLLLKVHTAFEVLVSLYRNKSHLVIDKYLWQREKENDHLIKIFIFEPSCCKGMLAEAIILFYYQQYFFNFFFFFFFFFFLISWKLSFGLHYKYKQEISNKLSHWDFKCKNRN